ncbi:SDR family oxidoreductase [Carboxylicivirga sp. M1479]|uniref:SDR family oxidoreductase n=1 Tax=Carboxylicivirga sp. M1479 TaxID=2594476 RepID=UPI00117886C0|nr:SDR family oxidoreductase [Carboxylicivirga sp. M1479]TRX70237.1 SDR family oxidoreductase [Carboxylicivirga sp. M1479]
MKNLKNKVVWITGASSGIGEALAYEMARQGARLVLTARNKQKLNEVKLNCEKLSAECFVYEADLFEVSGFNNLVESVLKQVGVIDVLINNAGMSQRSLAKDTPIDNDRKIMELNYFSVVALTKLVLPHMLQQGSGHVVAVSSIVGKFGFPLRSAYAASKHAIQGFFESLDAELSAHNINVTIVSPGRIQTNISKHALLADGTANGVMDPGQETGLSSEKCAAVIVKAIKNDKKDILVGKKELLMVYIHKFLPFLYRSMTKKIDHT